MKVAIVHHWFVSEGGGEHVAEAIAGLFPKADIFTLIAHPTHIPVALRHHTIHESFLARIPFARHLHRELMPLYPLAVEHMDLSGYDLVISSDAGPVKGVITSPEAIHLCYCHSPMRYVWNQYQEYCGNLPSASKWAFILSAHYARSWDYMAAQRVTGFLANSSNVAARIRHYYGRTSRVLYPPVDTERGTLSICPSDNYLSVGRLVRYKRIDLLIEACNHLGRSLRIVGTGPEEKSLRAIAGRTIDFLGHVDSATLWKEYAQCRALLVAANEDFGMVAVEAQACGRPVIAYGKGGSLESICSGQGPCSRQPATGLFFQEQSVKAAMRAMRDFECIEKRFEPTAIREWAEQFDTARFKDRLLMIVNGALDAKQGPARI